MSRKSTGSYSEEKRREEKAKIKEAWKRKVRKAESLQQ